MSVRLEGLEPRRNELGMTQQDLADQLFVKRSSVAMWETGAALPRAALLPAIAKALRCSIDELYKHDTGKEVKSPCREKAQTYTAAAAGQQV